jgi:hypothetical protein
MRWRTTFHPDRYERERIFGVVDDCNRQLPATPRQLLLVNSLYHECDVAPHNRIIPDNMTHASEVIEQHLKLKEVMRSAPTPKQVQYLKGKGITTLPKSRMAATCLISHMKVAEQRPINIES